MIEEVGGKHLLILGLVTPKLADPEGILRKLRSIDDRVQVQLFKPALVAGPEHLRFAARNALDSFRGKSPRSRSLAVELLIYASCQRQISRAIRLLGVEPGDSQVLVVALSDSREALERLAAETRLVIRGELNDGLVQIGSRNKFASLLRAYGVSKREIEAARFSEESDSDVLKRLIVERSALLRIRD